MQEITPEVSVRAEARREPTISGKSLIAKSYLRCLILLMFATALTASAQFRTSIQGVVTDTTGAVIPGATLTLTNQRDQRKTGSYQR